MNRVRQHLRIDPKNPARFDKEIDAAILARVRAVTGELSLTFEDIIKSGAVTIQTYQDTKAYRRIWLRVSNKKVLHIQIQWKKNILEIQEID